ncbi:MAG: TonB-dependent receptor, partial [Burkholderiales bacterium]|nr:TonB-dependent receptor [Burkholderiales bacterium]
YEHYEKRRTNGGFNLVPPRANVQEDDRNTFGGRALFNVRFGDRVQLTTGAETRYDRGDAFNRRFENGAPTPLYVNAYSLGLLTYGVFAQGQIKLFEPLKLVGGLRHDRFDYDIDNLKRPAASTQYESSVTTPRLGVVYTVVPSFTLFANHGEGFRAVSAPELSAPGSALLPLGSAGGAATPGALKAPKVKSRDLGFNASLGRAWKVNAAVYQSTNAQEIREDPVGSGNFVAIGDTDRDGFEMDVQFVPTDRWRFYGNFSHVKARVKNPQTAGQNLIPGMPDEVIGGGAEYTTPFRSGTIRANASAFYLNPAPYYIGASATPLYTPSYTRYDLRLAYQIGKSTVAVYAIFQPHRYASEYSTGTSIDTRPRVDGGVTYIYTF